jgi:hypothetical protein
MFEALIAAVRDHYRTTGQIPLHAPVFGGNEAAYVAETVRSTFGPAPVLFRSVTHVRRPSVRRPRVISSRGLSVSGAGYRSR